MGPGLRVDLELVAIRACWKLATTAIGSGTRHPWPTNATVNDLAVAFCGLLPGNIAVGPDPLNRSTLPRPSCGWWPSEAQSSTMWPSSGPPAHKLGRPGDRNGAFDGPPWSSVLRTSTPVVGNLLSIAARLARRFG
ncbi:MAG: hypothetical protein CM1200mP26_27010 [Acidimicrobiales bacterium]|nr:MAG: hypothetical protein CM1200mP26_27010 [Acidimicrobiales bacterium]